MTVVGKIHRCDVCGEREESCVTVPIPTDWLLASLFGEEITICASCLGGYGRAKHIARFAFLDAMRSPKPGDKVRLLANGMRGEFKGQIGVIDSYGDYLSIFNIRVPGAKAPREDDEYVGPYSKEQFEVIRDE